MGVGPGKIGAWSGVLVGCAISSGGNGSGNFVSGCPHTAGPKSVPSNPAAANPANVHMWIRFISPPP